MTYLSGLSAEGHKPRLTQLSISLGHRTGIVHIILLEGEGLLDGPSLFPLCSGQYFLLATVSSALSQSSPSFDEHLCSLQVHIEEGAVDHGQEQT